MSQPNQLAFLMTELDRWWSLGLVDAPTYHRIRWLYAARHPLTADGWQTPSYAANPAPPPQAVDSFDRQLEQQAQLHLDFEQRAAAERDEQEQERLAAESLPVASRSAALAQAALGTAADVMGMSGEEPGPQPVEHEVLEQQSRWHQSIRPFLYENALWLAGGLLTVVGSLYFLGLAWDYLNSLMLRVVVAGALYLYAGAFFGVGLALVRRRQAHTVGRVLFGFTVVLLPLANVAMGELLVVLMQRSVIAAVLFGGVSLLLALAAQGAILAVIGGLYERRSIRPLVETSLPLALLTALIAPLAWLGGSQLAFAILLLCALFAVARGCLAGARRLNLRMGVLLLGGGALWALGVCVVRAQLAASIAPTHYAVLLAALAALLIFCDHKLRMRAGREPRLSAIGLALHAVLLLSVAGSIAGLVQLGYFDLSARLTVLGTAAIATALFARAAKLHGRSIMSYLAVGTGLLAYFFLPAPVMGLLRALHEQASSALGYVHEPLPVAYYGLTFIPFMLLLSALAWRLRQRRADLSADLQRAILALGGLLSVLALTSIADLRPMLWTWPLYAAGSWALARAFARPRLNYAGDLLLIGFACAIGVWASQQGLPIGPTLLLALGALIAAMAALHRSTPRHVVHAAGGALALALPAALLTDITAMRLALAFAAAAIALGLLAIRTRSKALAVLAALVAVSATVTGCVALELSPEACFVALLGFGVVHAAAAHGCARAHERSLPGALFRLPTLLASVLALLGAFAFGLWLYSSWAPLLVALVLVYLAAVTTRALPTALASLALAAGAALTAHSLVATSWPLVLVALACGYLTLAAWLSESRPSARNSARTLAVISVTVLTVGFAVLWYWALPGQTEASWWGFAATSSLSAFGLTAALLHRHRRPDLAGVLLGLVAFVAAAASSFVLEALVSLPLATRLWLHGLLFAGQALGWAWLARRLRHPRLALAARIVASSLPVPVLAAVVAGALTLSLGSAQLSAAQSPPATWIQTWLAVPLLPLLCAGLSVLAIRFAPLLRHRALGWHLSLAGLLAGWTLLCGLWLTPGYDSYVLALAALLLGVASAWRWQLFERPISLAWPLGVLAVAALATHLDPHGPALSLAAACASAVLLLAWWRRPELDSRAVPIGFSLAVCSTFQLVVLWLALHFSTGRYPWPTVLALMAPATVAASLLVRAVAAKLQARRQTAAAHGVAYGALLLGVLLAVLSITLSDPAPAGFVVTVTLATLAVVSLLLVALGRVDGRTWLLHAAAMVIPITYWVARTQTWLSAAGALLDGFVILLASQFCLWTARAASRRGSLLAKPLTAAAVWWPMLSLGLALELGTSAMALLALLVALHYTVAAQIRRNKHLSVPAMLFGNGALFASWAALGWSDLLIYAIPVGVTALALVHVYSAELGPRARKNIRRVVVAGLYVLSVGKALLAATPLQALVLVPILCVVGIVVGTVARVRVYLVMGVAFLAADLGLNMLRYGLQSRPLGALFLTLLGLVLVVAMVVFSLERDRILRRYSLVLGELRAWD